MLVGERECSIQRRYQKIVEESPSCALTPELREKMGSLACELARTAGYVNAGSSISVFYDPMQAKFITWSEDRVEARKRMVQAFNGYHIEGISTNIDFLSIGSFPCR